MYGFDGRNRPLMEKSFMDMNSSSIIRSKVGVVEESSRNTPVKRRRLLPLVDIRNPKCGQNLSYKDFIDPSEDHVMEFSGSASVGTGRKSRPALTDLTKSGFCSIVECGEPSDANKVSTLGSAKVFTKGVSDSKDGTISRFPRLDQCAHFHYEFVELPPVQIVLVNEDLKPLSQNLACEDIENKSLLVQVTSLDRSWVVRRTYDNFRFLDKQLHRCCYDRKISQLQELPPEENLPRGDEQNCVESLLEKYLIRLCNIAGSLITCGPVLGWLELDNRGHRLIVTDDSDINTPAVAAAYVIKRYSAQASDEISFEVGDMISVIDMPPPEESIWWRGKRGFQVGFFPCECVQVIEGKVPQGIHPQALSLPQKRLGSNAHAHSSLHAVHSFSTQEPMKPVLRKHGKLIAFFRSFILSRPPRPWLKRSGILRERVFGCDLAEHLLNSGHDIPMVLKCCAEFIETHGTVDGIYRLSGITSNIQKLRNAFDEERVPALYEDESILQDIHCVSSVLKMYFRELPNPLLTYQLYSKFSQAVIQDEDVRLLHVRDVVQQLPPPHYRTLEYLIRHLARIASFSNTTGMTPKNIAIVWAPNLLRSKDLERGGVAALQDVGTQAVVTEYLVRYVDLIFNDKIPSFSPHSISSDRCDKLPRPKSLAVSTPVKLLSIDEARNRSLVAIKTDQNYIDVGGGPNSLPKTYHTVIDIPTRKGGSLKQKKSPLGWKTFFWKNKHQQKKNQAGNLSNISDIVGDDEQSNQRLRPTKSVESLSSNRVQLHSTDNEPVIPEETNSLRNVTFTEKERGLSSLSSPTPSLRTCSRSVSHDSYFNLIEKKLTSNSSVGCTDSEISTSPKFDLELKELNIEFKLSDSDVRIFSEDETLQSTSMDTASRTTLEIEGFSSRSGKSPLVCRNRISRPLKRNLLRSSSEEYKIAHLSPTTAVSPEKHYQSSGHLPKYAKLNDDAKRSTNQCENEIRHENPSDNDKSPSRGSFDSALIEPDLLERITHMRRSSTEEMGSVESLNEEQDSDQSLPAEKTVSANQVFLPSVEETPPEYLDIPLIDEDPFPEAIPPVDVEVHFELNLNPQNETPCKILDQDEPYPNLALNFTSSIFSPETPQSDLPFGEIQYHPLSDTTEPSTPSESHKLPDTTVQLSPQSIDISCDSLSSQYENVVVSGDDTPVIDEKNSDAEIQFSSNFEYETLRSDCSPSGIESTNQIQQIEPQYTNVNDSLDQESNHYENIDIQGNYQQPEYENCDFVGSVGMTSSAEVDDQSVYQQVKYFRRSIQEVNEILKDSNPRTTEKRKSITKMTIHFSKPIVSAEINVDNDESDLNKEDSSPLTPSSTDIIKETFSITASGSDETIHVADLLDIKNVDKRFPSSSEQLKDEHQNVTEANNFFESMVFSEPIDIEPKLSIEIKESFKSMNISVPIKPIPLPRTNIDKSKQSVETNRTHSSRSLTPPVCSQEEDYFEHPSSLPTNLAKNSSHDAKTWPSGRSSECCYEDETQKRERIEKYKEERRSVLRKNYHPSSFKGQNDDMLQRLKQKTSSSFRNQDNENCSNEVKTSDPLHKYSIADNKNIPSDSSEDIISNTVVTSKEHLKMKQIGVTDDDILDFPNKTEVYSDRKMDPEEVTVKERVAIWAQQRSDTGKVKPECTKPQNNSMPKPSPIVIQEIKDKRTNSNNEMANLHRPCVKSQSSDAISRKSAPVLPFKVDVASRRFSDVSRKVTTGNVTLKPTRNFSSFDPSKIHGSIGQDKIRAIAAQFEPQINPAAKVYLRQISK